MHTKREARTDNLDALPRPPELLELDTRLVDAGVTAFNDLVRVVLVPSWLGVILRELDLVRRDDVRVTVENHEAR